MSTSDFTDSATWGNHPVARRVMDATNRGRVVVTGSIDSAGTTKRAGVSCYECVLGDGTGEVGLVFLGRAAVPGIVVGTVCTIEGTVQTERDRLVVWNPFYRIDRTAPADSERDDRSHS